jgi:hypothetical protein
MAFDACAIRPATAADARALARVAALDSQRPLAAPVLLAEEGGVAVAAISLADGRVVADPFRPRRPRSRGWAPASARSMPPARDAARDGAREWPLRTRSPAVARAEALLEVRDRLTQRPLHRAR